MMRLRRLAALVLSVSAAALSQARADLTYTDRSAFLSRVAPGYDTETFDSLPQGELMPSPLVLSGNGFGVTASAAYGFYGVGLGGDTWLSTDAGGDPITFAFTGAPVTAIGGFFFLTDFDGDVTTGSVTLTLDDGTTFSMTDARPDSFAGFTTSSPIDSLTFVTSSGEFLTVNDLIVGQIATEAVPEPSSLFVAIGISGLAGAAGLVRRRRSRSRPLPG